MHVNSDNDSTSNPVENDYVPVVLLEAKLIQGLQPQRASYLCMLDSGSTRSWIKKSRLPKGCRPKVDSKATVSNTLAGQLQGKSYVQMSDIRLPEFSTSKTLIGLNANVFESDSVRYDIILGRDAMLRMGIDTKFSTRTIEWMDIERTMTKSEHITNGVRHDMMLNMIAESDTFFDDDDDAWCVNQPTCYVSEDDSTLEELGYKSKTIKPSDYQAVDVAEVANSCDHLTLEEREDLLYTLRKYTTLFNGKLGKYPNETVHLDVDPSVEPKFQRAYRVPMMHHAVYKGELDRLCEVDVLEKCGRSDWASPSFIIPKKDGTVRWITDFRALNKALRRKKYPIPRIQDILQRRSGYKYFTKIDVSMQYYTFQLDEASRRLCTISTPFGLYRYKRLPMGVNQSPDIAQQAMEQVLDGLDVEVYLDDIGIFSKNWKEHQELIDKVLKRLEDGGFTVNPKKCEWGVQETDFLGYWLTPTGLKPWKKKVNAILNLQPPTTLKELRSFIGMVNYYRDMWPRRAHILAPLTALTGLKKFEWNDAAQKAFEEMKALVAGDALLHYPDHNKPFDIETDASDYQLGAVIKQDGHPVAYYSRKLTSAQQNYTTIEKELLSIVETLKEFRSTLLGAKLRVYTDHKNLTHKLTEYTAQRVMRWRLLLEEYGCEYRYLPGDKNSLADALSRVPTSSHERENARHLDDADEVYSMEEQLAECLLIHPGFDDDQGLPINFDTIRKYQLQDAQLKSAIKEKPKQYSIKRLGDADVIGYVSDRGKRRNWRIAIPDIILTRLITWYHESMAHAVGQDRLEQAISTHYYHPKLRETIQEVVGSCDACQKNKDGSRAYGLLPPREAPYCPWHEIHVDTIGPWKCKVNGKELVFNALTTIDPVTNLLEINRLPEVNAYACMKTLENEWLSRYPRPVRCVHDQGTEFTGLSFQNGMKRVGVKCSSISSHNPQANSVVESIHKTVGNVLRVLLHSYPPTSEEAAEKLMDEALATAMHAARCAPTAALQGFSPGAVVFQRDMFIDMPLIADILSMQRNRQIQIDERLLKANAKRIYHDYKVGEQVLKRNLKPATLRSLWHGPYPIRQVHVNGTLTVETRPGLLERWNIRHFKPYRSSRSEDQDE